MATSSGHARAWIGVIALAGSLAAIVVALTSAESPAGSRVAKRGARTGAAPGAGAFSWLTPIAAPGTWRRATVASGGAILFYPSSWKSIPGDKGTVTAALRDGRGIYHGYLNITPRRAAEQLAGWAAFRTARNRDEGDARVRVLVSSEGLRFAQAGGSCVIDEYLSRVGSHPYRELACIVSGKRFTNVFVGAALVSDWPTLGPVVERAASALIAR